MSSAVARGVALRPGHWAALAVVLAGAGLIAYGGYRVLWFQTDDAFITFRYASNAMAGRGYVWNPPPFRPVEGYTSPAWLFLLHAVWWTTSIEPPESSGSLGLCFGWVTLGIVAAAVLRARFLARASPAYRVTVVAFVLFGTVTNRTFLTWLSSGLETSFFDAAVAAWMLAVLAFGQGPNPRRAFAASAAAALVALARPDGMLHVAATALLLWHFHRNVARFLVAVSPSSIVLVHLFWRRSFYGEWLPNTYHAKVVAPWPAAGLRYVAAFVLEYGLWFFLILLVIAVAVFSKRAQSEQRERRFVAFLEPRFASALVVVAVSVAHVAYYALVVGGDHFEYRVLCWAIPWIFMVFAWAATLLLSRTAALAALGVQIALSWPLSWIHFDLLRDHEERARRLFVPVADAVPAPLRPAARAFDGLQKWLVDRMIAVSQQEHRVFLLEGLALHPPRAEGARIPWSSRYVTVANAVGLVSWVFPNVAVIDAFGLNDWVVARNPILRPDPVPQLAHERVPPPGYVECFRPNFSYAQYGYAVAPVPKLTDDEIRACEARFAAVVAPK